MRELPSAGEEQSIEAARALREHDKKEGEGRGGGEGVACVAAASDGRLSPQCSADEGIGER